MLVLGRKQGQRIVICNDKGLRIDVTVADIRGDEVRLGIDAPDSIIIDRLEIFEKKRRSAMKGDF